MLHERWTHGQRHANGDAPPPRRREGDPQERLEVLLLYVERRLDLAAQQMDTWYDFADALRAGAAALKGAQDYWHEDGGPANASETLARLESAMTAGIVVTRRLRTTFDAFYADLDEPQRKTLDELMNGGRFH
jgi:hypothetical protein